MFILPLLLALISGLIIFNINILALGILLLLISLFLVYKNKTNRKKLLIFIVLFFLIGLSHNLITFEENSSYDLVGIVIKKEENYIILRTFNEKFYCYTSADISLYDIIKVDGYFGSLNFKEYESAFSFKDYLNKLGINRTLNIENFSLIFNFPFDFNSYKEKILSNFNSEISKQFVSSLLFGDLDYKSELKNISNNLMISNLLSTSGLLLNFILYGISRVFNLFCEKKVSRILSLLILAPFFIFNIYRFSFLRVLIFYLFNLFTLGKLKEYDKTNFIYLIYLVILIISPTLIYNAGYYLPLLIGFIFRISNLFLKSKSKIVKSIKTKIIVLFTFLPYTIKVYHGFNLIYLIFGLTFIFFFKVLFIIALISFYGIYFPFFDDIYTFSFNFLNKINFSLFNINLPELNQFYLIIYYVLFLIFIYFKEINFKKFYRFSLYFSLSCLVLYILPLRNSFTYEVSFINVSQGDSTLIRYKNKAYLIDTGGVVNYDLATNSLIPYLKSKRIYSLEAIFITHYDFDHYGALESLKNNFNVKNIYDYNSIFPINDGNIEFYNLNTYDKHLIDDENDQSLVLYLKIKDNDFLFMGDATTKIENYILENYDLDIDYLKLGHHGSKSSSSYDFLKEIDPKVAIISCGLNNRYNHPNDEVIENLKKLNIEYHRTDYEGTISYEFLI